MAGVPNTFIGAILKPKNLIKGIFLNKTIVRAGATVVDQGLVSVTNFASSIIIARACSKGELGLYMLGFSIILFVTNLQIALISSSHIVYSPRLQGRQLHQYTGSTLIHQLTYASLVVFGLTMAGLSLPLFKGDLAELTPVIWTLAGLVSFILLREYARQVCFATMRAPVALVLDSFVALVQIGGLLWLAKSGLLIASRAFALLGAGCGMASLAWLLAVRKTLFLRVRAAAPDFLKNWKFSKWLVACNFVYLGSNQIYPWLLMYFYGKEANGVLAACSGVLFLANPFLLGMGNFMGPKTAHALAEGGAIQLRKVTAKANLFFIVVMGAFCAIMIAFGNWLVVLLYGKEYVGNGILVAVLALGQLPLWLTVPTNFALNALERSDKHFRSLVVALAVTALLGIWLVKPLGALGVAWGLFAACTASCLYKYVVYKKEISTRLAQEHV